MKRKIASLAIIGAMIFTTVGCGSEATTNKNNNIVVTSTQSKSETTTTDNSSTKSQETATKTNDAKTTVEGEFVASEMFSNRDKEIGYDESQSTVIKLENKSVTISKEGTYILSGTISNGQVIVDAPETAKIQIVLNGVTINNDTSAAIYVKKADKVFITTAKGTTNTLSNKNDFVNTDSEEINAVLYSKEDLTLNGQGTLKINAVYGSGVVSKDDLVITSGSYDITAQNHGLRGKDAVKIADGTINIKAEKDAIHGENNDDLTLGYIYVSGGKLNLESGSDAMDSTSAVQIDGGDITINAGDDAIHSDDRLTINGGNINIVNSVEGIEGKRIDIKDGVVNVVSSDDGINATSGSSTETSDTSKDTKTTDNKTNTDVKSNTTTDNLTKSNKSTNQNKTNNAQTNQAPPNFNGQTPPQFDGQNPPQRPNGQGGGGFGQAQDGTYLKISGGTITINAEGDGIDSNGDFYVTGGTTYVNGPTKNGNGALDYDGTGKITGGTVIAVGSSGMAQSLGQNSTQGAILLNLNSSQSAGTKVEVKNSSGKVIASFTPEKSYGSIVVSSPEIKQGQTYTVTAGTFSQTVEMTSLNYGGAGGFSGGGFGGGKGNKMKPNQQPQTTINNN